MSITKNFSEVEMSVVCVELLNISIISPQITMMFIRKSYILYYRNRFVTQYITYLSIREALSGTKISLSWVDNGDNVPESASRIFK